MKKNIFRIFAVVAAAAMAFACTNDDQNVDKIGTHTVTFVSDYSDIVDEGTRTEIIEEGGHVSYKWTADDKERFFITENGKQATKKSITFSEDYKTATITATFANSLDAEVTYRCSVASKRSNTANASPIMLDVQHPAENSYDPAADILWAEPVTRANADDVAVTNTFRFARVVSVNKITLKGLEPDDNVLEVELTADKNLVSRFDREIVFDEKTSTWKPSYTGQDKSIELDLYRPVADDGTMSLYFTCTPVECTEFKVRVVTEKYIYEKALALSAEKTLKFTLDRRTGFAVNLAGCSKPNHSTVYKRVEAMENLYPDATYIIVTAKFDYAIGQYNNGTYHPAEAIVKKFHEVTDEESGETVAENVITITGEDNVLPVIIDQAEDGLYTIQSTVTNNYLAATGGSSANELKQTDSPNGTGAKWNITIGEDAIAAITANGVDRGYMKFNDSASPKRFTCYGKSNTAQDGELYLYVDPTTCHRTPRIYVSATEIAVNGLGTQFTPEKVTVRTRYVEGDVTVGIPAEVEDWILADVENGELVMDVEPNYSGEERTAVLTLSAEGAEGSAEPVEITVKQEVCIPKLSVAESDAVQYVGTEGADLYVDVASANLNEDIAISVDADWLIADWKDGASKNKTLNIVVEPLGKSAPRTATVTLSANGVSATVEVKQFKTVELDYSALYTANKSNPDDTVGPINVKFAANGGTTPQYYTNGTAVRAYAKNTFTVSSQSADIARIEITFGSSDGSNEITTDVDTYDNNGCWTGVDYSKSVKFTVGGTGGQRRIAKIKVFYVPGAKMKLAAPEVKAEATGGLYVKLSWDKVEGADSYTYCIGDEVIETTTETSVEHKMSAAGTYDWTVMATSEDSDSYDDSDETTGSVEVTGDLLKLAKPEVTVTTNGLYVTLSWKPVTDAEHHYSYKVGDTENTTNDHSVQVLMTEAGTYDWYVKAVPEDEDKYAKSDAAAGTVDVEAAPAGEEVSVVFITDGAEFTFSNNIYTAVSGPITVTQEGSSNSGYKNPIRVYANNTLTFDGGTATIVKIEFTAVNTYNKKLEVVSGGGSCTNPSSGTANVWTGHSSKVVLKNADTAQARYSKIVVTYQLGEGGDTPVGPTKLATPVVTATSNATSVTLSWNAVDHADSYMYSIGDEVGETTATSVTVNMPAGTYDWTVIACSNDKTNYTDSDEASGSVPVTGGGTTGPNAGDILWSEDWTGATTAGGKNDAATPSANYGKGTWVYGNATVTYSQSDNTVYVRNENLAGGTAPELILSSGKTWTISNIPTFGVTSMTLTYDSNNTKSSVESTTSGVTVTGSSKSYTITVGANVTTFDLVFSCSGNTRIDNVKLVATSN